MEQLELDFREWRPIKGYEGLYELRDDGYVKSLNHCKERLLKLSIDIYGYLRVTLSKNSKVKQIRINRLVYETFIGPIPEGYDIHHKNHNRQDNRLENLELIEHKKHLILHRNIYKAVEKRKKPVLQYTLDGEFVDEYESTYEAERQTGICSSGIQLSCKKLSKTAGNFIWCYKRKNNIKEKLDRLKKILQYTLEGEFVAKYKSATEASEITGINICCILRCCKGQLKTSGHYIWKYAA